MNRFKWPVKLSSSFKRFKESGNKLINQVIQLPKKTLFAAFLISLLIIANSFFWWYRATHKGFEFNESADKEPLSEWQIDMNEQVLNEENIERQYGLNDNTQNVSSPPKEGQGKKEEQQNLVKPSEVSGNLYQQADLDTGKVEKTREDEHDNITKAAGEKSEETAVVSAMATMAMPAMGRVTTAFAMDTLVYSKTLEQWNCHSGIDIAADIGTPVKAVMDGTVVEVTNNDPKLGVVIVIDHGCGVKTLYGNLNSDKLVKEGNQVKKGQVISAIGKTAPYEIEDPPHLHFEVLKDGKNIDPQQYLPKIR
ncbi:MAG: M23 family metallopeptidase [Tepidanaerobacter acetatoxydans]|jgi:murein DD-endopeptidase MepM/ murein hydrolase activator NlpD|uniref:M23 family metallopeptidase n=1 Tax=Tepidanaerobacter acetatoxydans TaxID=499229 RepID=UPI0026EDA35A|nr:M23 family metallopeptidase [Tepidanaerobacter acetatoxydans]NLU10228.1 M23 family metallopeptidase [Tepidanaerobacter acetatoxydans]